MSYATVSAFRLKVNVIFHNVLNLCLLAYVDLHLRTVVRVRVEGSIQTTSRQKLQAIAMAQANQPSVTTNNNNNRRVYHSVDTIDQHVYNGLTSAKARKRFMEMITRWVDPVRGVNINTRPTTGQIIPNRWKSHGYRIQRIQHRPAPADNAVAPPAHAGPLSMTIPTWPST